MKNSNPSNQEVVGDRQIEQESQLEQISLGNEAIVPQVKSSPIREGEFDGALQGRRCDVTMPSGDAA